MPKAKISLVLLWTFTFGCQYHSRPTAETLFHHTPDLFKNYDLKKPNAKYFLPYVLEEISGMAYYKPNT